MPRTLLTLSSAAALALSIMAGPAMAGGMVFDMPTLTWPHPDKTVTKSCLPANTQAPETVAGCPAAN